MSEVKTMTLKLDGKEWWREGIRFQCQGSGKCCTSHGEYGFVYMTPEDRKNMAQSLGIGTREFTKKYCEKVDNVWRLKEEKGNPDCIFLEGGNRCGVYEGRPMQCRTWPFWPEVLNAKSWSKDVVSFCPGVGKGQVWSGDEIEKMIRDQVKWDEKLGK